MGSSGCAWRSGATVRTTTPVVYPLTVATLNSIAVAGAGKVTASNLQADRLAVDISGAGHITNAREMSGFGVAGPTSPDGHAV